MHAMAAVMFANRLNCATFYIVSHHLISIMSYVSHDGNEMM